jgi:tetratricopeptide (TPR) repeat protein
MANYQKAIELDDEYSEAYVGIGVVLDEMGKSMESLSYFRKAMNLEKNNPDYLFLYAEVLKKTNKTEEASQALESLLILEPENDEAWLEFADLLAETEGLDKAIEEVNKGLLHCPMSIPLQFRKVAYLHSLGKRKEAYRLLQELLPSHGSQSDELTDYYPEIRKDPNYLDLCQLYGK